MDKRILIAGVVAVVVVLVAGFAAWKVSQKTNGPGTNIDSAGVVTPGADGGSKTKLPVPDNVVVPDANSQTSADVAKPTVVNPAAPGVDSKYRTFTMSIDNNDFIPSNVIINQGDIARITFTAVDKQYDVVQPDYGFRLTIPKGSQKILEGQFPNTGKYVFYCESCGGPDKGPVGYLTVVPKQ